MWFDGGPSVQWWSFGSRWSLMGSPQAHGGQPSIGPSRMRLTSVPGGVPRQMGVVSASWVVLGGHVSCGPQRVVHVHPKAVLDRISRWCLPHAQVDFRQTPSRAVYSVPYWPPPYRTPCRTYDARIVLRAVLYGLEYGKAAKRDVFRAVLHYNGTERPQFSSRFWIPLRTSTARSTAPCWNPTRTVFSAVGYGKRHGTEHGTVRLPKPMRKYPTILSVRTYRKSVLRNALSDFIYGYGCRSSTAVQ